MKRKSFLTLAVSSMATVLLLGCTQKNTVTPTTSPAAASPSPANSPTTETAQPAKILRSGTFVDGEHPTSGTASLVEKDGKRILELDEAFKTSTSGPDLVVVLHRSTDVIGSTTPPAYPINEGDYVILAPLQEYSGAQSYEIPENINLESFQSAAIWCRRFNATFGSARLQ
jgi:Electron transfer DM13